MEMWELLKSLFSEVNLSFWNASVVQTPQYSLADTDRVQSRSLELIWAESPALSRSVKAEEWIPSRAGAAQANLIPSYTSEKPHSWQVNSVWSMYDFFFSKRLRNTAACCYETYRVQREGRGESWESFTCCRLLLWHFNDTQTHRPCKSGWDIILQLSRHDSPGMSSLLCFSGRGYLWGQTPCSFVSTLLTLFRKKEI